MLVLAEISDKMPSVSATLAVSIILTIVALGLARLKWWLAALALPLFGFWNWIVYSELQETHFAALIWREMGVPYVIGTFASINIPPMIGALLTLLLRRAQLKRHRQRKGLCRTCGYPQNNERCPECGEPRLRARRAHIQ